MQNIHSHTHIQSTPSTLWTINHGLSCHPTVSAKVMHDGALTAIMPKNISYPDADTVVIEFSSARSGEARLA